MSCVLRPNPFCKVAGSNTHEVMILVDLNFGRKVVRKSMGLRESQLLPPHRRLLPDTIQHMATDACYELTPDP